MGPKKAGDKGAKPSPKTGGKPKASPKASPKGGKAAAPAKGAAAKGAAAKAAPAKGSPKNSPRTGAKPSGKQAPRGGNKPAAAKAAPPQKTIVKKATSSSSTTTKNLHLRQSITPGTVLILLAGRFRGMRVVFLKQLQSGLLLVTGPYKVNGIPLRRVNQAYVVATSTKIDVSGVDVSKFDDKYFAKPKKAASKKSEEDFFKKEGGKAKKATDAARIADQKAVDAGLLSAIKSTPALAAYLRSRFTLLRGQFPHAMKF
eukprot:Rmarinus@m.24582